MMTIPGTSWDACGWRRRSITSGFSREALVEEEADEAGAWSAAEEAAKSAGRLVLPAAPTAEAAGDSCCITLCNDLRFRLVAPLLVGYQVCSTSISPFAKLSTFSIKELNLKMQNLNLKTPKLKKTRHKLSRGLAWISQMPEVIAR